MSTVNKILIGLIFFIIFLLGVGSWDIRNNNIKSISLGNAAHAGIFDDIKDAISGHIDDVKDRLKDDQHIMGITLNESTFSWSSDSIHYANGSVKIVHKPLSSEYYVQLNEDFSAGLAPDLYIYLAPGHITSDAEFVNGDKLELGKLVKGSGASYYKIPDEIIKKYANKQYENMPFSVVIHCKRFNEPMGAAHF